MNFLEKGFVALCILMFLFLAIFIGCYIKKDIEVLSTDESEYIDWDAIYSGDWDEMIINQTDIEQNSILPHSIYFLLNGRVSKQMKIPNSIHFFIDQNIHVEILQIQKNEKVFKYLGQEHLSSGLSHFDAMSYSDGFFAKCYLIISP